ncbi:MAG: TolC family protein [Stenotrophobium sp.]
MPYRFFPRRVLCALAITFSMPVFAQDAGAPLSMQEAVRLALTDQPMLAGREAAIGAKEQQAVADAQWPDPKLTVGLQDLPVDTPTAYSVRDDNFTMFNVGISQDIPRGDQLRLKGRSRQLEAAAERDDLANDRRSIRRDTALAWLDVSEAEQALTLTRELADESDLQVKSLETDYRNGRASQADWLAAKVEAGLAHDKLHDGQHHVERMRAALSRWIGDDAQRPLSGNDAQLPPPADLSGLIAAVDRHPVVAGLQKQIEASETEVAMAHQAYKPAFSVEGYFGYRPAYSDFAGVQVSMDLPFFTRNRQDRELSAALHQADAASDRRLDALRQLRALVRQDYIDWQHDGERLAAFDSGIIPDAQLRIAAARSSYAAGNGSFDAALSARRGLLDVQLQRLTLAVDAARAQVRLQYFASTGDAP